MRGLLLAALLPGLYWDQGPAAADAVKMAGIERVYVPPGQEAAWIAAGITAEVFDPAKFAKLPAPGVAYRINLAAATSTPWVDANGWRFQRDGRNHYFYDVPWHKATLSAAETYTHGADAVIHPDARDLAVLGQLLSFLRSIDRPPMPVLANIGIVDDGSEQTGEILNLMARRNLLFQVVTAPDPRYDLNVRIGTQEFPKEQASDPYAFAALVRQRLTDEKRLLRLYGSDVVLGRLNGDGARMRVHLVNYGRNQVAGLRVRVRGEYMHGTVSAFGVTDRALDDYSAADGATEFTIRELGVYAVVDLRK